MWQWRRVGRDEEVQEVMRQVTQACDAPGRMQSCRIQCMSRECGREEGGCLPEAGGMGSRSELSRAGSRRQWGLEAPQASEEVAKNEPLALLKPGAWMDASICGL